MLLVNEGFAVKRQTEEALYCMQMMTRIQTHIYSRRLKTEEDKKALKSQTKVKQSLDKTKVRCIHDLMQPFSSLFTDEGPIRFFDLHVALCTNC